MILGVILMVCTLLVLVAGIILMATGGKLNKKYASRLMASRVILQFAALGILYLLFSSS